MSGFRRAQALADAGFGDDELRPLRIALDLLAQLADIDALVLRIGEVVPELVEQEFMRQHSVRLPHQEPQQIVLLRR